MNIPNVPVANIAVKGGAINDVWLSFFQNLITQMRLNLSNEGYIIPQLTASQVAQLNNTNNIGRIIYNTTAQRMMINNSGTYQYIDTV